jgi:hypothetical protein
MLKPTAHQAPPQTFIIRGHTQRDAVLAAIRAYPTEAEGARPVLEVRLVEHKGKRSLAQNRLFWLWMDTIAQHFADGEPLPKEAWHEYFCQRFLERRECFVMENRVIVQQTTSKLSVADFTAFLQRIEVWAAEKGLQLPHPDDYALALPENMKGENLCLA